MLSMIPLQEFMVICNANQQTPIYQTSPFGVHGVVRRFFYGSSKSNKGTYREALP